MGAAPPNADNTPITNPALSEADQEQWKKFEVELKKAQEALQMPLMDKFVRSSNPERELTVMDLKTLH
ncbi:hypothetical protein [Vampirovibrio sp.]|uniref:hypothetical protein n=1 Tax=Vampirovibrio sp. TaxID=2717857 RepID=UPI003594191F